MKRTDTNRGWLAVVTRGRAPGLLRAAVLVTLAALVVQLVACTGVYTEPTEKALNVRKHAFSGEGVKIAGYVTADGTYHVFDGRVYQQTDGTLRFEPAADERATAGKKEPFTLAQDEVASLSVVRLTTGAKVGIVVGVIAGVVVAVGAVAMATKESCPFLYSFDGERWVFDGEPYGGAISRGLARTDLSELEHLREVDGAYRLLVTNEVDETQHTDSLHLVVADHPPGTTVVGDAAGTLRAFRAVEPLLVARDARGRDLTRWLRDDDGAAWQHDLAALAAARPLAETRDTLEVEFRRPPGVERAWLVLRSASTLWASHMLRSTLDMRGREVGAYYRALDSDPGSRAAVEAWHMREEVFLLAVEVQGKDGWREQARVVGGGPFVAERRALPLDLSHQEGEVVRLRLRPPLGFWSFDSFALAWDEAEVRGTVLAAASATDAEGRDVAALLASDDGASLDFPEAGASATLTFRAPPPTPGTVRTVFAATRGWYDIHLHGGPEPDRAALRALVTEPGWIVKRAVDEFAEFERTGVVPGTLVGTVAMR